MECEVPHEPLPLDPKGLVSFLEAQQMGPSGNGLLAAGAAAQAVVVTSTPPPPHLHPTVTTLAPLGMSVPYTVSPYSFAVHPHHQFTGPLAHHPRAVALPPPHLQMYLSPPTFQYPPHAANQQAAYSGLPPPAPPSLQYYGTAVTLAPTTSAAVSVRVAVSGTAPPPHHHHVYPITAATMQQGAALQVTFVDVCVLSFYTNILKMEYM